MFTVEGKVVLASTREGIPDVVVVLYDSEFGNTHDLKVAQIVDDAKENADRLGSALTNSAGRFTISFEAKDFTDQENEKRPRSGAHDLRARSS